MRRSIAAVVAAGWGVALGGTFGCLLPYLLGYWTVRWSPPYGLIPIVGGAVLIGLGVASTGPLFGAEYERFRHAVPAWLPRLRPWTPPEHAVTSRRVRGR
jgi:hypothetical protein